MIYLKIGLGGVVGNELLTFEFKGPEKLRPYVSQILGKDETYGFKREFIRREKTRLIKKLYGGIEMEAITYKLERHVVYEYKRFAGDSVGEVEEGYFVILNDRIKELEHEEVLLWCNSAKRFDTPKDEKGQLELDLFHPD
jgi:hypothetical protein